ncbi:hypothetical protein PFISCL1PPCAC_12160, partial [Pristionchus fissidentatus]
LLQIALLASVGIASATVQDYEWPGPVPDEKVNGTSEYGAKSKYIKGGFFGANEISCPPFSDFLMQHNGGTPFRTSWLGSFKYAFFDGVARWSDVFNKYNFGVKDNVKVSCVQSPPLAYDPFDCHFLYSDNFVRKVDVTIRPKTFACPTGSKIVAYNFDGARHFGEELNCTRGTFTNTWTLKQGTNSTTLNDFGLNINCGK